MSIEVTEGGGVFRRRQPATKRAEGNISKTLDDLGIATDLEPEMAAQEALNTLETEFAPAMEIPSVNSKPFARKISEGRARKLQEQAAAQAKKEAAEFLEEKAARDAALASEAARAAAPAKHRPSARRMQPRPDETEPVFEAAAPIEGENPFFQAPFSAPPTTVKGRAQKPSPSLGKLGTTIAAMMPGAERVRVEKRLPNGNLGYIADYSKQDLASHPDLQSFLSKYVKPNFGAGEYQVTGLDGMGRRYEAGSVHLIDPPSMSENAGAMSLVQGVIAQQQKNHEEQIKELKETMQAQPNPVAMLRDVTALQKELAPPAPPNTAAASESTLASVITSSAQTSMQMMQMMMQQQQAAAAAAQQQTMLMVQQMQQASQQQMQMFMEMFKQKEESKSSSSAMPMPPPPPPENPMAGVKDIISMLGEMGVFGGGSAPPVDDTFKQMVLANQLGVKDVLALVKEMSPGAVGGGNPIKDAFDNMAVVMNMANQLKQNTEGSPQATIWDAVAALVSNRDFAGSIASAIRVNTEQVQRQTQNVQQRQLLAQQQALQLAAQQRQMAQQPQPRQVDQREITATPPAPRQVQRAESHENVTPIRRPAPQAAPQPAPQPARSLPPGFEEQVSAIALAVKEEKDHEIVEATINMVMFFYGFEEWKPVATGLLSAAQSGDKEKTLEMLGGFLGAFIEMGLMTKATGNAVMSQIDRHFEVIHAQVSGKQESILPPGIEEVFVVPDPEEIDETGNPLDEEEDEESEGSEGPDDEEDDEDEENEEEEEHDD